VNKDNKISWNISGKRASLGTTTKTISYSALAKSSPISQNLINKCVAKCEASKKCTFMQVIQLTSSSYGSVVCSLHEEYIPSHLAKYTKGSKSMGGKIETTYGIRRLSSSSTSSTKKATSTSLKHTSTVTSSLKMTTSTTTTQFEDVATTTFTDSATGTIATATATSTYTGLPPAPSGAQLIQLQPCSDTLATIPMFANSQYNGSTTSSAYIVQHGTDRNFASYFSAVYKIIGENGVIIAPNSYLTTDPASPNSYYQPEINLAWGSGSDNWYMGSDAVSPSNGTYALNGSQCSSYSTYDAILDYLSDTSLFPNMKKVYFVSHSSGAGFVSRYSQIDNPDRPFHIRYIVANSPYNAYFTTARPENTTTTANCTSISHYPYQWVKHDMPRYVLSRYTSVETTFKRWISRDVVLLTGNLDTAAAYPGGSQTCGSTAQGGTDRKNRGYAWWAYQNILVGTNNDDTNITAYYGYDNLIAAGAHALYGNLTASFKHQNCIVNGTGHDAAKMFASNCGIAALTLDLLPAGVSPS
jgi:hypothetical protein